MVRRNGGHSELIHGAAVLTIEDVDGHRFVGEEVSHPPFIEVGVFSDDEGFADH